MGLFSLLMLISCAVVAWFPFLGMEGYVSICLVMALSLLSFPFFIKHRQQASTSPFSLPPSLSPTALSLPCLLLLLILLRRPLRVLFFVLAFFSTAFLIVLASLFHGSPLSDCIPGFATTQLLEMSSRTQHDSVIDDDDEFW
jgi:hypothetical protein